MPEKATFFEGASDIKIDGTPQFNNIVMSNNEKYSGWNQLRQLQAQTVPSQKAEAKGRPAPRDQQVHSEPDVHSSRPPVQFPSPDSESGNFIRPAPPYTTSAPVLPTQNAPSTNPSRPAPAHSAIPPSPTTASPYLGLPTPQPLQSSTSLPQHGASPGIPQGSLSLELYRPVSAPAPSLSVGSSVGAPLTVSQELSVSVDLSARYKYLVTQHETRYEIRRKLIDVAQSLPKDKFFILKNQAMRANSILGLIEGSPEKIQSQKEVVCLCLESHAVAFVTIMAAETQPLDKRTIYDLFEILGKVEQLINNIVHKKALSMQNPFKKIKNENLVKSYRTELGAWLKDFQNDQKTTVAFALHEASMALQVSKASYMEQHAIPGSI